MASTHEPRPHGLPVPLVLFLAVLPLAGCATVGADYRPYDAERELREEITTRLGPEQAASVAIPFALDPEVERIVHERVSYAAAEETRVERLLDFVFVEHGLDYELTPTRSAVETFVTREGNCLSFVNLFVGLARSLRLNPFYVEVEDLQRWNYREGMVISHGHIVAGMRVDGRLRTFDFLPYRPKSYRDFEPIDDLKAMAHHYNNLGAEALMEGDVERAYPLIRIAVDLAPDFGKGINNLGVVLMRRGRHEEAAELYRRGLALDPESPALLSNLARAYQQLGRDAEAGELLARLEEVEGVNPYLFVYRGEAALADGDHERALEYMRKALGRDSEIPEVHVGLAKVYLALGRVDRATHHLERALRLDATHEEARRLARLMQRDTPTSATPRRR